MQETIINGFIFRDTLKDITKIVSITDDLLAVSIAIDIFRIALYCESDSYSSPKILLLASLVVTFGVFV